MVDLVNRRTGVAIAHRLAIATTASARRRGLLGQDALVASSALVLSPCWAIHTAFMRFPIDVVFVDREGCVVRIVRDLRPWRAAVAVRAHAVIELAGGSLTGCDIEVGDRFDCRILNAPPTSSQPSGTVW